MKKGIRGHIEARVRSRSQQYARSSSSKWTANYDQKRGYSGDKCNQSRPIKPKMKIFIIFLFLSNFFF